MFEVCCLLTHPLPPFACAPAPVARAAVMALDGLISILEGKFCRLPTSDTLYIYHILLRQLDSARKVSPTLG